MSRLWKRENWRKWKDRNWNGEGNFSSRFKVLRRAKRKVDYKSSRSHRKHRNSLEHESLELNEYGVDSTLTAVY